MSAKKQSDWTEAVNDAATGYAVVVLAVICFILTLVVIVAGIRTIVGAGSSGAATGAAAGAATSQSAGANGTA